MLMNEQLYRIIEYMITFMITIVTYFLVLIFGPILLCLVWICRGINKHNYIYNRIYMDEMPVMFSRTS